MQSVCVARYAFEKFLQSSSRRTGSRLEAHSVFVGPHIVGSFELASETYLAESQVAERANRYRPASWFRQ